MINNRLAGYFGIDFDNMNTVVRNANKDFIDSINVVTEDGLYITHENNEYLMNPKMLVFNDNLFSSYKNNMQDSGIYIKDNYWYTVRKVNNAPWYIAIKGDASYYFNLTRYLILFLIAFGILFIIGELIIVSISLIPISDRLDDVIVSLESMANGDFASRIKEHKLMDSSARRLSSVMEKMQRNIGKTMYKIKTGVEEVNKNGEAIANVSMELSNKANEQSVSLNNLIDAINAISSSIEYASKKTDSAKTMSDESFENTKVGVKMIGEIKDNMNEITEASNQISHIIETIQAIASQTNILALNAAVEAAREGEQGRGFAVVASEIRKLATTVSQATKDITVIVENAVTKIDNGSISVSRTSKTLDHIAKSSVETSSILLEISASSNEEIERINNINNDIGVINEIMIKNEELSKQASEASAKTSKMAEDIVRELSFFKFGHGK
ncbi:methyl-accepting chemotaxis protein [Brachyspira intermedia]|uniref:methyl-accepting chemotaxis protein n=1 Tax=Brachyspira intermedia TaxID=84377 RepID=UPI0030057815